MKITDVRRYNIVCAEYGFFTRAAIGQYDMVVSMIRSGISLDKLALLTYFCSEKYSQREVKNILAKELTFL